VSDRLDEIVELSELIDRDLVEIILYGGIEFVFDEDRRLVLKIESDFELRAGVEATVVHFAPAYGDDPSGLGALATIFRKTVIAAVAKRDGSLSLSFSNGTLLIVDHDDKYEAWTFTRESGESLISLPGGGLG
jgi:hypothetical protein